MTQPIAVTMTDIGYTYPGAPQALFEHVDATFAQGWTAVLGDNGIGKTTLLHMLSGRITPDTGSISPEPAKLVVSYCAQRIDEVPNAIEDFAADWSAEAIDIRQNLGIEDDWLYRFGTLSGGEAKRVQIACAMAAGPPDVLMLDEPSNHLDAQARAHIIAAMRAFQGIGIVVSHDRALIDAVCSRCLMFERRHISGRNVSVVSMYQGDYTATAQQIAERGASDAQALLDAGKEKTRLAAAKSERFARLQKFESLKRHGERIDRRDHDALDRHKGAKAGSSDKNAARNYVQMDSRIAAAASREAQLSVAAKRYDGDIWFGAHVSHRSELIRVDAETSLGWMDAHGLERFSLAQHVGMRLQDRAAGSGLGTNTEPGAASLAIHDPKQRVVEHGRDSRADQQLELSIGPRDHIAIYGPNGSGKTTLMTLLLGHVATGVPTLSIAQNTSAHDSRLAMDRLNGLSPKDRTPVLGAFAQLNADPAKLLASQTPSPGELRKLLLCLGILDGPELIAMDEPTNHLDMHSKEALARMLAAYPGALLVVSHDEWFLDEVAGIQWVVV